MQNKEFILTDAIQEGRELVARLGRLLFDRNLTDSGGGNISLRVGEYVCLTPSLSGHMRQWQLDADDIMVADMDRNILIGEGKLTREIAVHFSLHINYGGYGTAVIHCHPKNLMVFACMNKAMPPVMEATRKFGTTPTIEYAPAHSPKLAERITATMVGREKMIVAHAAGTIAPWHGLFLMGKHLQAAFDAVERLDTNAYVMMMSQHLGASFLLQDESAALEQAIADFSED